jgi:hypothetical protein
MKRSTKNQVTQAEPVCVTNRVQAARTGLAPYAAAFVAVGLPGDEPMSFDQLKIAVADLPPPLVANDTANPDVVDEGVDDDDALEALPGWVANHVRAVRKKLHTPLAMNIGNALGALSCAIQGRVRPVSFDGFVSHSCLYLCVAADPSERKSSAFNLVLEPIKAWVAEQQDDPEQRDALEQRRMTRERLEQKVAELQKVWKEGYDGDPLAPEATELREKRILLEAPPPVPFQYLVEDCTPEAFVDLLATHGRLATVSSDASVVFDVALGKYSKGQASITPYVKAYDGEWVAVHRIGRDIVKPQVGQSTTHSMLLAIQPRVLDKVTGNADFVGQGFAARMTWIVCEPAGPRDIGDPIPQRVLEAYERGLRAMLELSGEVRLSPEASRRFETWHYTIERRSRGTHADLGGEMLAWSGKHHDRTLRIAACLWAADGGRGLITVDQMQRAITLGRWLIPHAKRALQGGDTTSDEAAVLRWVERIAVEQGDRRGWVLWRDLTHRITPKPLRKQLKTRLRPLVEDMATRGAVEVTAGCNQLRLVK